MSTQLETPAKAESKDKKYQADKGKYQGKRKKHFGYTVDKVWFKRLVEDSDIRTFRKLSKMLNTNTTTMSHLISGRRPLEMKMAAEIARLLNVPLIMLLKKFGIDATNIGTHKVSVIGWVDTVGQVHMEKPSGPSQVPHPAEVPENAVALRIQDDGPMDGWLAYYTPEEVVNADAVGRWSVVQVAGSGLTYLRVIARGYEPGKWTLQPIRPAGEAKKIENVKVRWACPVIWIRA